MQFDALMYAASIWVIPLIIAITFHEAAHGYVARFFADNTAWQLGRVTLNPFKHIDPIGTILLPALLFVTRSPFLFGYAKPVPVNFRALRRAGNEYGTCRPRCALIPLDGLLSRYPGHWLAENLKSALVINVFLAIFNLLPLPPLDGGRIAVGLLPHRLAMPLAHLEPYGLPLLIGVLFILPILGAQLGINLSAVPRYITIATFSVIKLILALTGNT